MERIADGSNMSKSMGALFVTKFNDCNPWFNLTFFIEFILLLLVECKYLTICTSKLPE